MRCLALPILLLSFSACRSSGTEEPKEEEKAEVLAEAKPNEVEPKKEESFLDRGKSLGKSALAKTTKASDSALSIATETLGDGRAIGEASIAEVRKASEAIMAASDGKLESIGFGINQVVSVVAAMPSLSDQEKIQKIVILMVPVIGPTKRYLDARTTYQAGLEQSDERQLALARRETLMACAEMGLDVGTLGLLGGGVDVVATGADKILGALKLGRTVNVLTGSDSDVLNAYLDSMLENDDLRASVDASLRAGS